MTFDEYLINKKIDRIAFEKGDPEHFAEWSKLFEQVSEPSFTAQKLFLINAIRRKYLLQQEIQAPKPATVTPKPKPVIKPRPKIN